MRRVAAFIANRRFRLAFATTFLMLVVLFLPAAPAYASIADDVNAWLAGLLRDACNWMFTNQVAVLSSIGYDGIIGADFSQMLTTAGDMSMYDIAHGVWDVAVLPIGCGVLSLVFTVKLIQISQRMDGNASFPGVKAVSYTHLLPRFDDDLGERASCRVPVLLLAGERLLDHLVGYVRGKSLERGF